MALEILDRTPDWDRFVARFDNASRRVLRLRQKVVVPTLPTVAPRWVVDPDFNLDYHVRRIRVAEPGSFRQVLDLAEVMVQSPLDIARPLWTVTLIEGLPDGKAATVLHLSHAVTDGVGSVEMFAHIYDLERDPPAQPSHGQPIPEDLTANDLMREGLNNLPVTVAKGAGGALWGAASIVGRVVSRPSAALWGALSYARSGARVMARAAEPSPLLRRRSLSTRSEALDIPLSDLHRAAKAGGGSINDAYLAGLCGALGRYHQALGVPIAALPMAVPVSLRSDSDAAGGNRFTGVNLAAPIGTLDPVVRMQKIRQQMTQRRDEPAMDIVGSIAPVLSVLPGPLLESMTGSVVGSDVQASNVPVYPGDTFLVGAKVLRQYGIGPLPGVAMMVVLISRGGYCTITARYDRAAIRDEKLFAKCLVEGFDEILALAGDPAPHAVLASRDDEHRSTSSVVNQ